MRNRRHHPLAVVAPILVASALSLAACGNDDEGSDSPSSSPASGPATSAGLVVTGVEGIRWDEDAYTATAGDVVVTLRNESSLPHTLLIRAEDGSQVGRELETPSRNDEDSDTYALPAGTFTIICTIAGHGAMKAELTVS